MDKHLKKVLQENEDLIIESINLEAVIECMLETEILSLEDQEELEQNDDKAKKVKKFLRMIERKGSKCFEYFLDALVRTDNTALENVLRKNEKVPSFPFGNESNKISNIENVESSCHTFIMHNEDHTLGNALRYVVMKDPKVEFCGYGVPHPFDNKINFRIQTKGDSAVQVLVEGFSNLNSLCKIVLDKFEDSVQKYKRSQAE